MKNRIVYLNLLTEMARNKVSKTKLAELCGVTRQSISLKLRGMRQWNIGEIETICKFFNKSYYELFVRDE